MNDACDDGQRWRIVAYCGEVATILRAKTLILKPKLRQVVTQYKMWNEVMFWLTQMTEMMGYNEYVPLLITKIYTLQFLMSLIRPSFSAKKRNPLNESTI